MASYPGVKRPSSMKTSTKKTGPTMPAQRQRRWANFCLLLVAPAGVGLSITRQAPSSAAIVYRTADPLAWQKRAECAEKSERKGKNEDEQVKLAVFGSSEAEIGGRTRLY